MHTHSSNPIKSAVFCSQFLPAFSSGAKSRAFSRDQIEHVFAELVCGFTRENFAATEKTKSGFIRAVICCGPAVATIYSQF
jgi:hypothetical protein